MNGHIQQRQSIGELHAALTEARCEIEALQAERARLAQRLELANAAQRAAEAGRDAALRAAAWRPLPKD
jgi:hypothetical protein